MNPKDRALALLVVRLSALGCGVEGAGSITGHASQLLEAIGHHAERALRGELQEHFLLRLRLPLRELLVLHLFSRNKDAALPIHGEPSRLLEAVHHHLWPSSKQFVGELGEPHQPVFVGFCHQQVPLALHREDLRLAQPGEDDRAGKGRDARRGEARRQPVEHAGFAVCQEESTLRIDGEPGGLLKAFRDDLEWSLGRDRGRLAEARRDTHQAGHDDPGPT